MSSTKGRITYSLVASAAFISIVLLSGPARALPGTHGLAVSTWDTSASSVVFAFHQGIFLQGEGHLSIGSYNANFTSTSGKLSAQFGLHYLNYQEGEQQTAHGISGTAITVYGVPVLGRHDNGLARGAFTVYFGGAPSALIGGEFNYLSIPIPIGIGLLLSPARAFSITPFVEIAPSINVDTAIRPFEPSEDDMADWVTIDPDTGQPVIDTDAVNGQMQDAVTDQIDVQTYFSARFRGGLAMAIHLGDRVDLGINGIVAHMGNDSDQWATQKRWSFFVGGHFSFAWDDPPSAVLPASKRLDKEDCPVVYERFQKCPGHQHMIDNIREKALEECDADQKPVVDEVDEPVHPPGGYPTTAPKPTTAPPPQPPVPAPTPTITPTPAPAPTPVIIHPPDPNAPTDGAS